MSSDRETKSPGQAQDTGEHHSSGPNPGEDTSHSAGRRRFLLGVAAAAPVIMTVANRPVWANGGGGNVCWSGLQSGNLSTQNNTCTFGCSPGYYKDNVGGIPGWPSGYDAGCGALRPNGTISTYDMKEFQDTNASVSGTLFGDVFTAAPGNLAYKTLMQVLWQDEGSFAFHAIANFFNALNFPDYTFKPNQILNIANDILATGQYIDDNGKVWTAGEMILLFQSLYS